MLLTRVRVSPWRLLWSLFSVGRVTTISSPSCATPMRGGSSRVSVPLGPFTVTTPPVERDVDAGGDGDGETADTGHRGYQTYARISPPSSALLGLGAGHDPARGADDDDAEAAQDPRDVGLARVHAQARLADPLEARDDRHLAVDVLHPQPEELGGAVALLAPVGDEAFLLEDAGDLALGARGRHDHLGVAGAGGVADPREHVRDRVGDVHLLYQLDFVTPGSSPASARSRKQIRHSAKRRM